MTSRSLADKQKSKEIYRMIVILVAVDSDSKTRIARTTNGTALTRPGYRFKDNEHSNGIVSYLIRIKFMFSGNKS
jgi:hypothetical protein